MKNLIYMAKKHQQSESWFVKGLVFGDTNTGESVYIFENLQSPWSVNTYKLLHSADV